MSELWNDLLELNWAVLAVVLAILGIVVVLVAAGLLMLGVYLITRVPPIRWVFVTLLDAATLPARRWAETTIDTKLAPFADVPQMLADHPRLVEGVQRAEAKAEKASELALRVEAATQRLQLDVDDLTTRLDAQITYRDSRQE